MPPSNAIPEPVLTIQDVGKTYVTPVLQGVSLNLFPGEVLALTGENGAGKSTLAKIICGLEPASQGKMTLAGQEFAPSSRRHAESLGVRMVMQELSLIPTLTVAENLLLVDIPNRGRWQANWIERDRLNALATQQLAKVGMQAIDPNTLVSELGIGQQQMVEIARNLQDDTRVLILDEPTAMLTPSETHHLFEQIARLQSQGVAIIYVSHRLEELKAIADTLVVLRDGKLVQVCPINSVTEDDIVQLMVGHAVSQDLDRPRRPRGNLLLRAEHIGRGRLVKDISLDLYAGEVLGLAGLVGSGRTEVVRLLFGADQNEHGEITVYENAPGQPVRAKVKKWAAPLAAIAAGIGLITEDRKSQGLLLGQPIRINTTLSDVGSVSKAGWLQRAREVNIVKALIDRLSVRCNSMEQAVGTLSGGNQQKVIVSRWLHRNCDVLLLDEPTRGVDVGARADIYAELEQMAQSGKALLMVSSDLRELMQMADRIGVMSNGKLIKIFERGQWTEKSLLAAAFNDTHQPVAPVAA
ncbi:sugar ABC transporter ATP-binding protein [Rhodoferax fermentans]|uniref:Sugar ABC transporter ATP-binding protein n=1 Tax=Rhodoferax fermentans TaxID=28066 RepID=A0A1T1AVV1_RHOFE|nr:sugar ABC transporter ATP-binding protein [Rhodoferax fermentans]MBK1682130.1 sugar ABC transporter ATP-binding protein [Rhodoferax fermentans]OOV08105.1 sugar ABC transporter ATP-binding protein [Rhodoferax fermentans]